MKRIGNTSRERKEVTLGFMGRFVIIDGHSLANRAFYAMPMLTNSKGEYTNAVYGFAMMLMKIIEDYRPDMIAVAFDRSAPTFRHEQFKEYKAQRKRMPEELRNQIPVLKEFVAAFDIPIFEIDGYEADDVIGTLTLNAEAKGFESYIVTGDKDALQLVSDKTHVLLTRKGVTDIEDYTPERIMERYGVTPAQMKDIKGLMGDSSDNIPGVPGVGEKTAVKLIGEFGSIENLIANIDKLSSGNLAQKIREYADQALFSKELATIARDVPIEIDLDRCILEEIDRSKVMRAFAELGFNSIRKRLDALIASGCLKCGPADGCEETNGSEVDDKGGSSSRSAGRAKDAGGAEINKGGKNPEIAAGKQIAIWDEVGGEAEDGKTVYDGKDYKEGKGGNYGKDRNEGKDKGPGCGIISDEAGLASLIKLMANSPSVAIEFLLTNGDPMKAELVGVAVALNSEGANTAERTSNSEESFYIPIGHSEGGNTQLKPERVLESLDPVLGSEKVEKLFHNAKRQLVFLRRNGFGRVRNIYDTMIAAYVVNPNTALESMNDIVFTYLEKDVHRYDEMAKRIISTSGRWNTADYGISEISCYYGDLLPSLFALKDILNEKLKENGAEELFAAVEMPLVEVLADMELRGVAIDTEALAELSARMEREIEEISEKIYISAGERFNINSPKQLGTILFEKLKLPAIKKTKTGYSTDAEVLEELAINHEIAGDILSYRTISKLKSTYVDVLPQLVNPATGRVHTFFNQAVTATGRLSSSEPNLQNIPIRGEEGKLIRAVFIPGDRKGYYILSADYSQIELRVLAHISGDRNLIQAFMEDQDIHTATAAQVFKVKPEDVTPDMRGRAKAVNFGIVYGISDFGLARNLGIPRGEAKRYIESYLSHYSGVKEYMERIVQEAKKNGYVTTIMNRRRYLPELFSPKGAIRSFAERTAMNTPIQGSAADIIKIAMVRVSNYLKESGIEAAMLLQVHDELVFEVERSRAEELAANVKKIMEGAVELSVPLKVDVGYGENWMAAK